MPILTTPDIHLSLQSLLSWIEKQEYKGWDPYDGLLSPIFRLPVLRSNRTFRFYAQQAVKRSPVNLRPLLAIPKGLNPVTLGLCIQAYAYLAEVYPDEKENYREKGQKLTHHLKELSPYYNNIFNYNQNQDPALNTQGLYNGACWGYDFPWQARYASLQAYQPSVVSTGIVTNGLFEAWSILGIKECKTICESAASFVLDNLKRTYDGDTFCFSYSPFDQQQVLNASMKGVRILVQAADCMGGQTDQNMLKPAAAAVQFVLKHQRPDGSFPYSLAPDGGWIDNYHTGYVLDCLDEYRKLTEDETITPAIEKGFEYYRTHFLSSTENLKKKNFSAQLVPRFYNNKTYPVDTTAAAQTILTLCRFGENDEARAVANFMIEKMQSDKGYFHYRLNAARLKLPTAYMRWSNAWMAAALAYLLHNEN